MVWILMESTNYIGFFVFYKEIKKQEITILSRAISLVMLSSSGGVLALQLPPQSTMPFGESMAKPSRWALLRTATTVVG